MDKIFLIGLAGSIILIIGAAWPEPKGDIHPAKTIKNWLFAMGGLVMLTYSIFSYQQGGSVFFILLQGLVSVSSVMMMLDVPDKIDIPIITISGLGLIIWSLFLFEDYSTIFFILGLSGIAMGYALKMGTVKRSLSLTLGSILIAIFSYIGGDWVFFWLNVFFSIFSGYYAIKIMVANKHCNFKL